MTFSVLQPQTLLLSSNIIQSPLPYDCRTSIYDNWNVEVILFKLKTSRVQQTTVFLLQSNIFLTFFHLLPDIHIPSLVQYQQNCFCHFVSTWLDLIHTVYTTYFITSQENQKKGDEEILVFDLLLVFAANFFTDHRTGNSSIITAAKNE